MWPLANRALGGEAEAGEHGERRAVGVGALTSEWHKRRMASQAVS